MSFETHFNLLAAWKFILRRDAATKYADCAAGRLVGSEAIGVAEGSDPDGWTDEAKLGPGQSSEN